jgi:hypothetical protein
LDESRIRTAYFDGNLLHFKPFNLNCTFGTRTNYCLSNTSVLSTVRPFESLPLAVSVIVLLSSDTTTLADETTFPSALTLTFMT